MPLPDGAAQVFSEVTRFSALDVDGFPVAGSNTFTTTQLLKATLTPVIETGVDLVTINANGDIAQHFKHGDMPKYYTMAIEVSSPDPILQALLAGGTVLVDNSVALVAPTTPVAVPATTGGTLASGSYQYACAAANQYGETLLSAAVTATVTGPTGAVALTVTTVAGAPYYKWYGRVAGAVQLLGLTTAPAFTDTGALTPAGSLPTVNDTAGPGNDMGYQAPPLAVVSNPDGIGVEFWGKAILNGTQTSKLPYYRWAVPGVLNLHHEARTFQANILENAYTGQAQENPNWGGGPFNDFQADTTKVFQYVRASRNTVPPAGLSPVPATA